MAGRGPAPKHPSARTRRNRDAAASTELLLVREPAPDLPPLGLDSKGNEQEWHPQTLAWWAMWSKSELARDFAATDWSFLLDTALMHHAMWSKGQWTLAAEVRLRVAKFGATPEDRARLRITFADADERDDRRTERRSRQTAAPKDPEKDPRRGLHAV